METTLGRQHIFMIVTLGCVLCLVLLALAMFYYPGGTFADPTTANYSFFGNFLGDLGRGPLSLSGHLNLVSPWLFALALGIARLCADLVLCGLSDRAGR